MRKIILLMAVFFLFSVNSRSQSVTEMHNIAENMTKYVTIFDDFTYFNHVDTAGGVELSEFGWITAINTCSSLVVFDTLGGVLKGTTINTDNMGLSAQWNAETFKLDSIGANGRKPLLFRSRFLLGEVEDTDFILGLSITDTDLSDASTDGIYFKTWDASDTLWVIRQLNSGGDTTFIAELTDTTWYTAEIRWNGYNRVTFQLIEGADSAAITHTATANTPMDEELALSFGYYNGEDTSEIFYIDYIYCSQALKRED